MNPKRIQIIKDPTKQLRCIGIYLWSIWDVKKEKNGNYYIQMQGSKQLTLIKSTECKEL